MTNTEPKPRTSPALPPENNPFRQATRVVIKINRKAFEILKNR